MNLDKLRTVMCVKVASNYKHSFWMSTTVYVPHGQLKISKSKRVLLRIAHFQFLNDFLANKLYLHEKKETIDRMIDSSGPLGGGEALRNSKFFLFLLFIFEWKNSKLLFS